MSKVDVTDDPDAFEEAVRAFRRRVPMPDWKWDALTEAEREMAFKVSGVAQADLATDAWGAMDRAIKDGTTLADFKAQIGEKLEAAWGKKDPARLETIFRTNALGAYNAGRHEILNHPEVKKARPFWRFDAVMDSRTSEICQALDGVIRPADDPFWHAHTPPLHFNCRSVLVPLSEEEAKDEGVDDEAPDVDADEGFGRQPGLGGDDWEPDTKDYPEPIGELLEGKLESAPANEVEPEPEPEHPAAFPRVPSELAPELPEASPFQWERTSGAATTDLFFADNDAELKRASAELVCGLTGKGFTVVTHKVNYNLPPGVAGQYNWGPVELRPDIAKRIRDVIVRGAVRTPREDNAIEILLHEQFHAASTPDYRYTGNRIAMEEATTEILAQHYNRRYQARLGLHNSLGHEPPMFADVDGKPVLSRMTAYPNFVKSFAQLVSYVDGVSAADPAFERHVAGRALQVKRLPAYEGDDHRYGLFTRGILDKHGIKGNHPEYTRIVDNVSRMLHDYMLSETAVPERIADLDRWVGRIVKGEEYR